ncbi:MAG: hypothetical protein ACE5HA_19295, partial [Anaerolineae bacterium]
MMKHRGFAVLIPLLLILACSLVLAATPPESQCVGDANGNGVGDIVDIMATAVAPDCQVYLPVVAANWRQPWPTPTLTPTITLTATPTATATTPPAESCIPSGDHSSIQNALTDVGSMAVLCPNAVFELGDTVYFTADDQQIYTQGLPTDDSRALLRVVGDGVATAVSAEGND